MANQAKAEVQTVGLVINGTVTDGAQGTYPVTNPVRPAEVVLNAPAASPDQVDEAVAAARQAFPAWAAMPFDERLGRIADAGLAAAATVERDDLARLLTREHGKIYTEALFDAAVIGGMAHAFAPAAQEALRTEPVGDAGTGGTAEPGAADAPTDASRREVQHVPLGVTAAILPFNWPVAVLANKALPALLTGNTMVVKTPPTCPGTVLRVAAAMAEVLPPGVLGAVNGPDAAVGEALVAHPGVDMVSFTGGIPTGRAVMAAAAGTVKPVVLELGGNDAAILAPDVAITEALADALVGAAFPTSGQVCMAIKRLYVHQDQLPALVDALVARLARQVVGDGLVDEVTMGPVHRPAARDRVERFIEEAAAGGARVHRPARVRDEDRAAGGYLVSPAIVESPPPDSSIMIDEQFAPALPVLAYRDLDEAVGAANASAFGLCASIWSGDQELAASVARRLEAGTVFVNAHGMFALDPRAPMGGWKQSGIGLELGVEGMRAFTRSRTVLPSPLPGTG